VGILLTSKLKGLHRVSFRVFVKMAASKGLGNGSQQRANTPQRDFFLELFLGKSDGVLKPPLCLCRLVKEGGVLIDEIPLMCFNYPRGRVLPNRLCSRGSVYGLRSCRRPKVSGLNRTVGITPDSDSEVAQNIII
jgi:hypothetical protein